MEFKLKASKRQDVGKGASRRLRREQGVIPAVVYGGKTGPLSLTINHNDLINMLEDDKVYTSILSLEVDGKKENVMLKDLQRHSFKNKLIHADFKRIIMSEPITVAVPVMLVGEAVGSKEGGVMSQLITQVDVHALPTDIPQTIELDVTEVEVDGALRLSDIKLSDKVELLALKAEEAEDLMICQLKVPKEIVEEEPEVEGEEGAEGEAAEGEKSEGEKSEGGEDKKPEGGDSAE
jgi:large subunit ribosomal protein L25